MHDANNSSQQSADPFSSYGIDPNTIVALRLQQLLDDEQRGTVKAKEDEENVNGTGDGHSESEQAQTNSAIFESKESTEDWEQALSLGVCCCVFFHGFHEVDDANVQALANAAILKLDQMCQQLQILGNRKRQGLPTSFKNPVHQVLQMNSLPVQDLLEFYETRVIGPCQRIAEKFVKTRKEKM